MKQKSYFSAHLGKYLAKSSSNIMKLKDYIFLTFAFILCVGICAFSFCLGFPGYIIDYDTFRVLDFELSSFGPAMNPIFIAFLSFIFSKHTFYLFLLNNLMLYLGIWFLIAGFYLRYKSVFALTPILIAFIGNIYLGNFIAMNYILMANFIFCAYCIILFLILTGERISKKIRILLWIFTFLLLFLGLLWRHNAIFSAFPAFFIIIYLFLKNRDSKAFLKQYALCIAMSAVVCLTLVIEIPRIVPKPYDAHTANHLLLLQIAGACVPANDATCFKDEWYYFDGKVVGFESVKEAYQSEPMNGDLYICDKRNIFECGKLFGLTNAWARAILKYPRNFIAHEARFFKAMWWQNPRDDDEWGHAKSVIKSPEKIQEKPTGEYRLKILQKNYPKNEWSITFNPLQEKIYTILYDNLPVLNHAVFVALGFVLFVISGFLIVRWRKCECDKSLIIFTFATALTAFASAVIIAGMAIVTHSRYMSPVAIFSVIALVGFVAFVIEMRGKKAQI